MSRRSLLTLGVLLAAVAIAGLAIGPDWFGDGGDPPEAVTGPASFAGTGSGTEPYLTGAVATGGLPTTFRFEYAETEKGEPSSTSPFAGGARTRTSSVAAGSAGQSNLLPVKAGLSHVAPNTTYRYRVVASNAEGVSRGTAKTFVTPPGCMRRKCGWSLLEETGTRKEEIFKDVSCPEPATCIAVASEYLPDSSLVTLWNGHRWRTIDRLPGELRAISCPAPTWCAAVGSSPRRYWSLRQEKSSPDAWRVEGSPAPLPEGSPEQFLEPNDVSCASEDSCIVVGSYRKEPSFQTYVARWNGENWAFETAANPKPGVAPPTHGMQGASCVSADFCVTVGALDFKPFVEHWDGRRWRMVPAPNPAGSSTASLEAVSCASPQACIAVGAQGNETSSNEPLVERWDGTRWSIVRAPRLPHEENVVLHDVSCPSAASCIAVGGTRRYTAPEGGETVIVGWNGSRLETQPSPDPHGTFNALFGVSCPSPVLCLAGGFAGATEVDAAALAEGLG